VAGSPRQSREVTVTFPLGHLSIRLSRMAKSPKDPLASTSSYQEGNDNPVWFKPVMFGLMLVGLAWILSFYISGGRIPIPMIGSWNIAAGFGIMFVGFLMTTRWK
jgi:hypothetical protein